MVDGNRLFSKIVTVSNIRGTCLGIECPNVRKNLLIIHTCIWSQRKANGVINQASCELA